MANISRVLFSQAATDINFIPTNRTNSTFRIIGGPRLPGYLWILLDANGDPYTLNLAPFYEGQLIYSNALGDDPDNYTISRYSARLFVAVKTSTSGALLSGNGNLKWVPVVNYYFEQYIDPSSGETWDPVRSYVCDPPYLCPETP